MALLAGSVAGCQPSDESSTGGVDTDQTDISDSSDPSDVTNPSDSTDPPTLVNLRFQSKLNSWRKAFQVYKK